MLPCALAALGRIGVALGASRDEAVRQILTEHVTAQEHPLPTRAGLVDADLAKDQGPGQLIAGQLIGWLIRKCLGE